VLSEKISEVYKRNYNPETEITITSGATQAIYTAITATVHEGDEVVLFEPAYDCYAPAILLAGGIPVYISLKFPEYAIDWEKVKKVINHKTKMIIINTPHNPMGSIMKKTDMTELEKIVSGTDIIILSDEVYEHIIFDDEVHESVIRYPGLAERSFAVFSFGKTYHTTGWKIGYCVGPSNLMSEFRKIHQFVVFSVNTPIQYALSDYIKKKNYRELPAFYQRKRDYFLSLIKNSSFDFSPSKGSYFQSVNFSKVTGEKDSDFAVRLTKEFKVAAIPVSAFYHEGTDNKMIRFCFAKKDETLERAAERICAVK
jgi:methionine aminotransferase